MANSYDDLIKKLKEIFQLDQADLDFGIYRIMNQKRDEITRFLEQDLLPQVKDAFAQYQSANSTEVKAELDRAIHNATELGMNPDDSPKVKELRQKLGESVDITKLEDEVYSYLFNFFRRYYDEGDFISLRRYKEGVYAIPYEGEEVKLHWANADQYYVKTTENFRDYAFRLPSGKRAHFKLVDASVEKDNNKAVNGNCRRFFLSEQPIFDENGELIIPFEYKPCDKKCKQADLNTDAVKKILAADAVADWRSEFAQIIDPKNYPNRTLLEKHLTQYTAKNTFDFFIHKDLSKFLRRELDFYIKNEVMHLDDIEHESAPRVEQYLSKIRAIRQIAHKVIDFLAQIENFQKKLWLKKKFVVETNYCITLGRVPDELYSEIAANDAQREEWIRLFAIDEIQKDVLNPGYSMPLTAEFLRANPHLVLDTRFYDELFKAKLIASIECIDGQCDGLLIHSENFQALGFIQRRYRGCVKYIYIDPPYNTGPSEIIYRNNYKHSTWLSLMHSRLASAERLCSDDSVLTVAIDDNEMLNLGQLLQAVHPDREITPVVVVHNPRGNITRNFAETHEYALFLTKAGSSQILRTLQDNTTPRKLRRWGENSRRTDRPSMFYPFYVRNGEITRIGQVPDNDYHPAKNVSVGDEIQVWPIDQDGVERRWNFGLDSVGSNLDRIVVVERDGELDLFVSAEKTVPKTVWTGGEYDAGKYGKNLLENIVPSDFTFPKSINNLSQCLDIVCGKDTDCIVLDYFAGSGTTGHALINLNRKDGGKRKYVLVEMGSYFERTLKQRITKVIYSDEWKDCKPTSRNGSSHMFKYIRLESYEDALNNLELRRTEQQKELLDMNPEVKEDYMLRYMLDVESKGSASLLNIEAFEDPFNYKLNIATGDAGETRPTVVDLVETFNYLLGLTVKHIDSIRGFRVVEGTNPAGDKVLVIWRNVKEKSNDDLNEFFQKQGYNTQDMEFDLIYVNGDNNLENLRKDEDTWKVRLIEEHFQKLMFDVEDV